MNPLYLQSRSNDATTLFDEAMIAESRRRLGAHGAFASTGTHGVEIEPLKCFDWLEGN